MRLPIPGSSGGEAAEIANIFAAGVTTQQGDITDFGYEAGQASNIQPVLNYILRQFMVPWLLKVLKKWSEPEFHQAMRGTYINSHGMSSTGRDFIEDFRLNHNKAFSSFVKLARKHRSSFRVDLNEQVNGLIMVLNRKGWTIYDHEKTCLYETIRKIMVMIYS
jgi:hypothetical protein